MTIWPGLAWPGLVWFGGRGLRGIELNITYTPFPCPLPATTYTTYVGPRYGRLSVGSAWSGVW